MRCINNYFLLTFLITIIFYIIVFERHECSCIPLLCNYSYNYNDILYIKNGSLFIKNIHIHHWMIGVIVLAIFYFKSNSIFKSMLYGIATAAIVDGLCFEDRFNLTANWQDIAKFLPD
jgi:hypothetical protein